MVKQYVLSQSEIDSVRQRLTELRHLSLLSRDGYQWEGNREFYLRAKGFEEALTMLGLWKEWKDK